ncbi:MAG: SDR family oxidoreductase [Acidimicrobiales bacterium]
MDLGIRGKRAAVAAGSAGLGLGTAVALATEGVHVAICGRDEGRLAEAVARCGPDTVPVVADVSTVAGATRFVEEATGALDGLDILVPNAGGPPRGGFTDTSVEDHRAALELNLLSVVAMCHAAVPSMRSQGWGRVVAITSIAVRQPIPGLILSNTARAGATGFLKTLAREVAADGVTVNSVQPGTHDTERIRSLGADTSSLTAGIPAGRLGDPDDFGCVVAFLCSAHAGFVTGAHLNVDGGAYAGLQ